MPPEERFGHAPMRGVPQRCLLDEIASFVVDSSRSYATIILLESIIRLFQPPNHESTVLLSLSKMSHSSVAGGIIGNTHPKVKRQNARIASTTVEE